MSTSLGLGERDTETKQTVSCSRGKKTVTHKKSRVDGGHRRADGGHKCPW